MIATRPSVVLYWRMDCLMHWPNSKSRLCAAVVHVEVNRTVFFHCHFTCFPAFSAETRSGITHRRVRDLLELAWSLIRIESFIFCTLRGMTISAKRESARYCKCRSRTNCKPQQQLISQTEFERQASGVHKIYASDPSNGRWSLAEWFFFSLFVFCCDRIGDFNFRQFSHLVPARNCC